MNELSVYEKEEADLWPRIEDKYSTVKTVTPPANKKEVQKDVASSGIQTRKRVTHQIDIESLTTKVPIKIRRKRWG
ncbi:MAG: hypothetical protein JWO50_238 [Candidatus Kaiserbacteria bacterium]|nr:hypothetical protein [Candidatus Kaiserbacteria bacterium]